MKALKKTLAMIAILTMMANPVNAQILTMDEEENTRLAGDLDEFGRIPNQWVSYDQYNAIAPLGEGIFLLSALGGAYLIRKKRKNK